MSYASLMAYIEADAAPEQRVCLAAGIAGHFAAQLIGISALAIPPPVVADGVVLAGTDEVDIKLMEATLADKGNWFRSLIGSDSRKPEWRSALDFPVEVLAREARSADLVVIGQRRGRWGAYRSLDPGEAILKIGRPTLVVPEGVGLLRAEHVVIGWKDTREARHAVRGRTAVSAAGDARQRRRSVRDEREDRTRTARRCRSIPDAPPRRGRAQGHARAGELHGGRHRPYRGNL
jgi:hypothetical protein